MSAETIRVLVFRPMEDPQVMELPCELSAMQQMVGGYIQVVYPFDDDAVIVCNEEGKLQGLPPNRLLRNSEGEPYDVVCGTFFVAGVGEEDFCSLSEKQIQCYTELLGAEKLLRVKQKRTQDCVQHNDSTIPDFERDEENER